MIYYKHIFVCILIMHMYVIVQIMNLKINICTFKFVIQISKFIFQFFKFLFQFCHILFEKLMFKQQTHKLLILTNLNIIIMPKQTTMFK
jgi:hypothetical protein